MRNQGQKVNKLIFVKKSGFLFSGLDVFNTEESVTNKKGNKMQIVILEYQIQN